MYRPKSGQNNEQAAAQGLSNTTEPEAMAQPAQSQVIGAEPGAIQVAQSTENKFDKARNWSLLSARELLQVTNYVDAKDQVNNWCVGQVSEENVDAGTVKIHFEGWSERHDAVLKKNSNKMAPFRSMTHGYTGQRKNAFRDFKLNQAQQIIIEKKV